MNSLDTPSRDLNVYEQSVEEDIGIPGVVDTARIIYMMMQDQGTAHSIGTFVAWVRAEIGYLSLMQCAALRRIARSS